ncbi:MAG: glycoside hydrolase family 3 C-terminal domain-containing protein [Gemmatimonadetes bacterium]|nr:glycoside hydrolase family 3 C-terminal domain-containing protein [Gemmatimonadota bacterium]
MIPGDLDSASFDYSKGIFGLQVGAAPGVPARDAARAHAARVDSVQRWFIARTGIPIIVFDEALHGLVREGATVFPQAIALAATWDSLLVRRVHEAAARETGSRGIRQVLSPVVNLATDVRWGRVEETSGEDVHLTSVMGRQFVRAFEGQGIIATPKHFVANVGEGGRDSYPIDVSRRALEERYFPPFRSLIADAGARSVMTAYNSVDGSPATQSPMLLNDVLKRDWGLSGFIISDAAATGGATVLHRTEASTATAMAHALGAGLDVIFQSSWPQHRPYLRAVEQGLVPDNVLDASVLRVLRTKFALGLFDEGARIFPESAAYWAGHATHRALAREAARASLVLLRNAPARSAPGRDAAPPSASTLRAATLPLRAGLRRLAVIGADADSVRLGGYSGPGIAPVSILAGIRARAGTAATVRFARGPGRLAPTYAVVPAAHLSSSQDGSQRPGLRGEYWANNAFSGPPRLVRTDAQIDFGWTLSSPGPGIPYDWYSVRWMGTLAVPAGGATRLGVEANDGYRLWLDGKLLVDAWEKRSFRARLESVALAGGSRHEIRLEYFESTGNARVKLVWDAGVPRDADARIAEAVQAARASEAAVVVVGIEEGEFRDRASLALPGRQEELIRAVAATGTATVVVIVGGSAVTMSRWLDDVGAVLMAWYPGEEGGHAIADVLFGDADPSGRLPITFPLAEGQLPLTYDHKPTGRGDDYLDLTGQPLFPFGYGLTYTRFEYSDLRIELERGHAGPVGGADSAAAQLRVRVRARVSNAGTRAGSEVVQLYLRDVLTSVAQPLIALKGFTRIALAPGESQDVEFLLTAEHLRLLNEEMRWVVEPGLFRVMVGASSRDIRLRGEFTLP